MAEQGSLLAMLVVAHAYLLGNGIALDKAKAEHWYRKVADTGSVFGHHCLGRVYLQQKRYAEAKPEFEFSAARGFAPAYLDLGKIYLLGLGVEKERERGCKYLQLAADGGNVFAKAYLARMTIRYSPSWIDKMKAALTFMSALFEGVRLVAGKRGWDNERLIR